MQLVDSFLIQLEFSSFLLQLNSGFPQFNAGQTLVLSSVGIQCNAIIPEQNVKKRNLSQTKK